MFWYSMSRLTNYYSSYSFKVNYFHYYLMMEQHNIILHFVRHKKIGKQNINLIEILSCGINSGLIDCVP